VDVNQTVADLKNMLTGLIHQDIVLTCRLSQRASSTSIPVRSSRYC
jgi:hypothetical protein